MKKNINLSELELGVCYYPEHWDPSLWNDDLNRMLESGIKTVRIAEFAWNVFEPSEGEFTFELFDNFMEAAKKTGMKVIFGTPTATPPIWLTEKYPEALNCDIYGNKLYHGCRRHYNYNSPKYNELSKIIVEKLAIHYGQHPNIVGWQIDNELNCQIDEFYSESDSIAFREFLKIKYSNLENLNRAWGTVFWNQTYTKWEEIFVPRLVPQDANNQHHVLDYIRFISDSVCKYAKMQSDILRKHISKDMFITTNGMFGNMDNHRMTEESLDFYTYDSYPNFAFVLGADPLNSVDLNDRKWSKNLAEVRSISNVFGIMEQQSGPNGWTTGMEAPAPKPGQLTLWTMQSVAHGADYISYFRWRTCTKGTEIYWHGILDYSNRDNRRLEEVKKVNGLFENLKEIAGAEYKAKIGILKDYDNIWDAQCDKWHENVEKVSQAGLFQGAQLTHTPFDYVYLKDDTTVNDLNKYELLFYPHATIISEERADLIKDYVKNGGKIIFGSRTAYKDLTGQCVMEKMPWLLDDLTGTDVVEFTNICQADGEINVTWGNDLVEAPMFNDILEPIGENSKVLGEYNSNYYKGSAALIENTYGSGKAYYYGGTFTRNTTITFLKKLGFATPYNDVIKLPEICELAVREKDGVEYLFVLNYSSEKQTIKLEQQLYNMYTKSSETGEKTLLPYETVVYKR